MDKLRKLFNYFEDRRKIKELQEDSEEMVDINSRTRLLPLTYNDELERLRKTLISEHLRSYGIK